MILLTIRRILALLSIYAVITLAANEYALLKAGQRIDAGRQWIYTMEDGGARIERHAGEPRGNIAIPDQVDGHAVTAIGREAFGSCSDMTGVIIPKSVVEIAPDAFDACPLVTLIVEEGSFAERFAKELGIPFEHIQP
jgi:hypothetical protein